MQVTEVIKKRRAYRSLERVDITRGFVEDLATHAGLAASCFNFQPWRFMFVYEQEVLEKVWPNLSKGNKWVESASMIIVVFARPEDDCSPGKRDYYLFDTGMACSNLILRATELGLVAHPIAGFNSQKVIEALGIPEDYKVITLIIVGKKAKEMNPHLSEEQIGWEKERPERKPLSQYVFHNKYQRAPNSSF
jgi:nitroreductase